MTFTAENILLVGSILLFISIISSKTSFRFGIPALILFLVIGMLAGSDGIGGIYFNDPHLAQMLGALALCFILFSGGMDTKWESVKPVLWHGISLSTIGVLLTAVTVGLFVTVILHFSVFEGLLLGAIVSSTDAAAVFSILRSKNIGLKGRLRPLLELESGSNDPMAYFLTISMTFLVSNKEASLWSLVPLFIKQMAIGATLGYLMGRVMVFVLNKIKLDIDGLYPVLILALMIFTFSFTDSIGGNGFLAIYLAGLILGNNDFVHKKSIMRFYDGQAWLMQIIMFLTLGLLVFPSQIVPVISWGVLIALFLIFIARPIGVFVALSFFKMRNRERIFISWVGLRGAVPIVFATYPLIAGVSKAEMIFNLVFFISISSVLLQGATLPIVAKWLHLTVPVKAKRRTMLDLELFNSVKSELSEFEIPIESKSVGMAVMQLKFPKSAWIVLINRQGKYLSPDGTTVLQVGDKLLVMADNKQSLQSVAAKFGIDPLRSETM